MSYLQRSGLYKDKKMNLSKIRATYIPQIQDKAGIWEKIEQAARTCYKSEGNIRYNEEGRSLTAYDFANKIIGSYKHHSVAEHATIYAVTEDSKVADIFLKNKKIAPYSRVEMVENVQCTGFIYYITTNYRVLLDNKMIEYMRPYLTMKTIHHVDRYTVRVFTDRGVTAELNRHRVHSPSERSTRYVDQIDGLSIIIPQEYEGPVNHILQTYDTFDKLNESGRENFTEVDWWLWANMACELAYTNMRKLGVPKQKCRRILPMDIESEIVITAFRDDWMRFFDMRLYESTGPVHPDMMTTAKAIYAALKEPMYLP